MRGQNTLTNKISRQKHLLERQVSGFRLRDETTGWPGGCDVLFASVRKYYTLLPIRGLTGGWTLLIKHARRRIISEHLSEVCVSGSVTNEQIWLVDTWLGNIDSPRDRIVQYGRMLQEKYGSNCFICGQPITEARSVDHILPISRGGNDDLDNLLLCHHYCNAAKNNLIPGDSIIWAPASLSTDAASIPLRLRYLVHLRDNFTCTTAQCTEGILTGHPIGVVKRRETGIACYDNLRVECWQCTQLRT